MRKTICDSCKKEVKDVCYSITVQPADLKSPPMYEINLHWDCLPTWVKESREG